jgi:hypothetical protein
MAHTADKEKDRAARESDVRATVLNDVEAERLRQVNAEGYDASHDDLHGPGELTEAALCYVEHANGQASGMGMGFEPPRAWPWERTAWKPKDRRRNLIRAAALIVAEIERMDRIGLSGRTI